RNILINEHNSLKNYLDEKFIVFILEIQLQTLLHKKNTLLNILYSSVFVPFPFNYGDYPMPLQ
ncbi:hypothetical protein DWE68_23885, partial [Salmonella enterica]|nr:hypothetical protein [Salmonella enterica]